MISINGARIVIAAMMVRNRFDMFHGKSLATRISMTTAIGKTSPATALYGFREFPSDGLLITTATGHGFHHGAGPGSMMRRGVTLRSITADGWRFATAGH